MLSLIDYEQVGCVSELTGIGGPPLCGEGEAEGTPLDVITVAQCEGRYVRREAMAQQLNYLPEKTWALYSVIEPGPPAQDSRILGTWQVVLVDLAAPEDSFLRSISPWFNENGLSGLLYTCGQGRPTDLEVSGTSPDFLLPPP